MMNINSLRVTFLFTFLFFHSLLNAAEIKCDKIDGGERVLLKNELDQVIGTPGDDANDDPIESRSLCKLFKQTKNGNLVCSSTGMFKGHKVMVAPYRIDTAQRISLDNNTGVTDIAWCEDWLKSQNNQYICTPLTGGDVYIPMQVETLSPLGDPTKGVGGYDNCRQVLSSMRDGLACAAEGDMFGLFKTADGAPFARPHGRYSTLTECFNSYTHKENNFICLKHQNAYVIYHLLTGEMNREYQLIPDLKDCKSIIRFGEPGKITIEYPNNPPFSLEQAHGKSSPRNGSVLYRGQEKYTKNGEPLSPTVDEAVAAMLGDDTIYVESLLFSAIKYKLANQGPEIVTKITRSNPQWSFLDPKIQDLHEEYGYLSPADASIFAASLIDLVFDYENSHGPFSFKYDALGTLAADQKNRLLNYDSIIYQDWANDIRFSSLYQQVAAGYGEHVIVFHEKAPFRSVDLGHWNKFSATNYRGAGADASEFITPGYIPPQDLIGLQVYHRGKYPNGARFAQKYNVQRVQDMKYAFYKLSFNEEDFVVILDPIMKDGTASQCIKQNNQGVFMHCVRHSNYALNSNAPATKFTRQEASLMGVIRLCPKTATCERPENVFAHFNHKSDHQLPPAVKTKVEQRIVNKKSPKVFY